MSTPSYPRTATTIRPPLRILDASGQPVLGLAHDAPGLAIEWRRVGGPATWTPAPQTAAGWTETGDGFYDATIAVGDQAGETVAVRWTYGGVTSLPGFVSFTGAEETSGSVSLTQTQIDAIASAASSSAGETMRSITVPISGTVDAGSFTVTVTSADPLEDTVGWIIESQVGSRPFSTVIVSASAEGDGTHTLTLDRPFPDFFPAGGSLKITDTPFRHFTGAGRSWPASPRVPADG